MGDGNRLSCSLCCLPGGLACILIRASSDKEALIRFSRSDISDPAEAEPTLEVEAVELSDLITLPASGCKGAASSRLLALSVDSFSGAVANRTCDFLSVRYGRAAH